MSNLQGAASYLAERIRMDSGLRARDGMGLDRAICSALLSARDEALEEAARVAESKRVEITVCGVVHSEEIAAAIRALKSEGKP